MFRKCDSKLWNVECRSGPEGIYNPMEMIRHSGKNGRENRRKEGNKIFERDARVVVPPGICLLANISLNL